MPSILEKKPTPLELIIPEPVYLLHNITARYKLIKDNTTTEISGFLYDVSNTDSDIFLSIFVAQNKPIMPIDEFQVLRLLNKSILVEFKEAFLSIWFNNSTNEIDDKVVATSILLVECV